MITLDELNKHLRYNPDNGEFRWRVSAWRYKADGLAGTLAVNGYIYIGVAGTAHLAHRLAWLVMTGEWPVAQIDHIDGVRTNNAAANLRAATAWQNSGNSNLRSRNRSGFKGVFRSGGKWSAQIRANGKNTHLGMWTTPEDAARAYDVAALQCFGEYAKTNRSIGLLG